MTTYKTNYSEKDWEQVKELLGRAPRGLFQVEKYHPEHGHPMVIKVVPFVDKAPFPTLYWLTCPILKKEISHIEKDGWIEKIGTEYFSKDSENLKNLRLHHQDYCDQRVKLFDETIKDWSLLPPAMEKILRTTGIGGIHDFDNIKCFHLHYAHHLVSDNQVGKVLDEVFNIDRFY